MPYMDASYLMGTVVIPLILGQTEPLLVPGVSLSKLREIVKGMEA